MGIIDKAKSFAKTKVYQFIADQQEEAEYLEGLTKETKKIRREARTKTVLEEVKKDEERKVRENYNPTKPKPMMGAGLGDVLNDVFVTKRANGEKRLDPFAEVFGPARR